MNMYIYLYIYLRSLRESVFEAEHNAARFGTQHESQEKVPRVVFGR